MNQELSEALNDCLDRLIQGESIQDCLSLYPQHAQELEPLLHVAFATMRVADTVRPSPAAKSRNFERFTQAVAESETERERKSTWGWPRWIPVARPILVGVAAIAVFVMSAGVATAASSSSVPGEPLHWVKTTKESIESNLPRSDEGRANYEANLAHVRGDEVRKLIERGHFKRADQTMKRMTIHLRRSAHYAGITVTVNPVEMPERTPARIGTYGAEKLKDRLDRDRQQFRSQVERVIVLMPPENRPHVKQYIMRTELGYRLIIGAIQNDTPANRLFIVLVEPPIGGRR